MRQPELSTWSGTPDDALTVKYDDPNTLLIGGAANGAGGHTYQIAVTRDANRYITGFNWQHAELH